jgi:hypothetical protein
MGESAGVSSSMALKNSIAPSFGLYQPAAPVVTDQRLVVQDTSLSMQVKDVPSVLTEIEKTVVGLGGYMVNRSMSKPEGAATGDITVRVPTDKRETALNSIKSLGIKTVSEIVNGTDVTDQYVDIQGRINNLNSTKSKIEAIMEKATRVQDLMDIQMQLDSIQSQIDNYIGQQKYLEQTAKLTRISVSLSTDELSLPYSPDTAWRPTVIFKTAVRSMLLSLRSIANSIIWIVAYTPIFIILVIVFWLVKVFWKKIESRKTNK